MTKFYRKHLILIILSVFILLSEKTFAQQNIIKAPNSEVLPEGTVILKETSFASLHDDVKLTPSLIMGLGHGMDLSVGVPVSIGYSNANATVSGDIGLKKVFFIGPTTRFTLGASISPYLNQSVTPNTFAYAHLTQRIKQTKSSFTVGTYVNGEKHFLNTTGVLLGFEQVIIPNKLRLACDWMSGDNNKSNFAVGLKYRPQPTLSITTAVVIPNTNTDRLGFQLSLSKFIQFDKEERSL
ncbi:MAG: hypothetical protein MJ231_00865 [bacterium]|nr:hypothetical protein [bacterium]